jgi:hypothetical protein
MPTPISLLYEALTGRDDDAVRKAVLAFRSSHAPQELFEAVARFAVLSYSPSQHGKHAVIACLAAHQLRDQFADHYDQILTECAVYASQSRLPWSEPPLTDPPPVERDHPFDDDELRQAVAGKDRARAERWLARRMQEPTMERSFFELAAEDLSDQGHKLIVATTAWQLAELMGEQGVFATLRMAVVEWTAYAAGAPEPRRREMEMEQLLRLLIDAVVAENGSTMAFHRLALFDAALSAAEISGLPVDLRVRDALIEEIGERELTDQALEALPRAPVYPLARDYAAYLQAHAIVRRLQGRFPALPAGRILAATKFNLDHGPSFEEWSFA